MHRTLKMSVKIQMSEHKNCSIQGILELKKKLEAKNNYGLEVNEFQS
jgi:hypothetical protein